MLPNPAQGQIHPFAKHMGKEEPSFSTIPAEQMGSADPSLGRALVLGRSTRIQGLRHKEEVICNF